jgi:hypothetical protein
VTVPTDTDFDFSNLDVDDVETDPPGALHGTSSSRGTRGGTPRRGRRPAAKKLETLQRRLSQEMFSAGAMIGFGLPVTGYYVCQESDNFTKAVVQLASHRPEWIDALEHLADIQPGIVVGRTVFGIGASIAVDRERIKPERQFLKFLGVTAAWEAVNNPDAVKEEGSAYQPPPSKFTPV